MKGDNISRAALLQKAQTINIAGAKMRVVLVEDVKEAPASREEFTENVTFWHPSDEFICAKCGIHLRNYDRYNDDGDCLEYIPKHCPECGLRVKQE